MRLGALLFAVLLLWSCAAGPAPPLPLGLGPGFDQIFPIVLLVIAALLVWKYLPSIQQRFRKTDRSAGDVEAESTIRQRYARGEVTREQYLQMLDDLQRKHR